MTEDNTNTKLVDPRASASRTSVYKKTESLHARVAAAPAAVVARERIALLLDCSGSMASVDGSYGIELDNTHAQHESKLDLLKRAVETFVQTCGPDTALALLSFPEQNAVAMTLSRALVVLETYNLRDSGDTPMGDAMRRAVEQNPTRCVIVSDGDATDGGVARDQAEGYAKREPKLVCDCVHIGTSSSGEETLKYISETTGGVYLKFEDVAKLVAGLKYLTPAFRGMLTSGSVGVEQLGVKEIQK